MESAAEPEEDFPTMRSSRGGRGGRAEAIEGCASTMWTLLFFAYSSSTVVSEFGHGWGGAWTVCLVLIPVLLAGSANVLERRRHGVRTLCVYVAYVVIPAAAQLYRGDDDGDSSWLDLLTVLWMWVPLLSGILTENLSPTGHVKAWPLLTSALSIVNTFTVLRPLPGIGYSYRLSLMNVSVALLFAAFALAGSVALAVALDFAKFRRRFLKFRQPPHREAAVFFGMYVSAVTEELLFRGLMQNMAARVHHAPPLAPLLASCLAYSAAHVSKKKMGWRPPNYRFAFLAFVQAIFYGLVWQLTEKVTASALTHAIVDFGMYRMFLAEHVRS